MGLLSRFIKKDDAGDSRDSGEFRSRAEDDSFSGARSKERKAPAARRARVVDDPLLPEKKRARRRLIGAVALALAAVIGLPIVLDSEPKSSPDDIQVRIPSKDKLTDLAGNPSSEARPVRKQVEVADENQEEIIEPASPEAPKSSQNKPAVATAATAAALAAAGGAAIITAPKAEVRPAQKDARSDVKPLDGAAKQEKAGQDKPAVQTEARTEPKSEPKTPAKPEAHDSKADVLKSEQKAAAKNKLNDSAADHKPDAQPKSEAKPLKPKQDDDASRAMAILEGKSPAKAADKTADRATDKPTEKPARLVYQVAALASQEKVDELQAKLKSAGVHSYTQKVATSSGDKIRVRIGPFESKEEAERARAKLSKLGLNANPIPN